VGIEPTRPLLPRLQNTRFAVAPILKCDGRVNFRGMWGHLGIRERTIVIPDVLRGIGGHRTVYTTIRQLSTSRHIRLLHDDLEGNQDVEIHDCLPR
jgi:hypothetical protein